MDPNVSLEVVGETKGLMTARALVLMNLFLINSKVCNRGDFIFELIIFNWFVLHQAIRLRSNTFGFLTEVFIGQFIFNWLVFYLDRERWKLVDS